MPALILGRFSIMAAAQIIEVFRGWNELNVHTLLVHTGAKGVQALLIFLRGEVLPVGVFIGFLFYRR